MIINTLSVGNISLFLYFPSLSVSIFHSISHIHKHAYRTHFLSHIFSLYISLSLSSTLSLYYCFLSPANFFLYIVKRAHAMIIARGFFYIPQYVQRNVDRVSFFEWFYLVNNCLCVCESVYFYHRYIDKTNIFI